MLTRKISSLIVGYSSSIHDAQVIPRSSYCLIENIRYLSGAVVSGPVLVVSLNRRNIVCVLSATDLCSLQIFSDVGMISTSRLLNPFADSLVLLSKQDASLIAATNAAMGEVLSMPVGSQTIQTGDITVTVVEMKCLQTPVSLSVAVPELLWVGSIYDNIIAEDILTFNESLSKVDTTNEINIHAIVDMEVSNGLQERKNKRKEHKKDKQMKKHNKRHKSKSEGKTIMIEEGITQLTNAVRFSSQFSNDKCVRTLTALNSQRFCCQSLRRNIIQQLMTGFGQYEIALDINNVVLPLKTFSTSLKAIYDDGNKRIDPGISAMPNNLPKKVSIYKPIVFSLCYILIIFY